MANNSPEYFSKFLKSSFLILINVFFEAGIHLFLVQSEGEVVGAERDLQCQCPGSGGKKSGLAILKS